MVFDVISVPFLFSAPEGKSVWACAGQCLGLGEQGAVKR